MSKKITWLDWLPESMTVAPSELMTREDLLDRLYHAGVETSLPNLRRWEYDGVLPAAIRQRHEGASRAVYPPFVFELAYGLRRLQRQGWSVAKIARFYQNLRDDFRAFMAQQDNAA